MLKDFVARQLPVGNLATIAVDGVNLKPPLGDIYSNPDNLAHLMWSPASVENRPFPPDRALGRWGRPHHQLRSANAPVRVR
jgi:hypothetical protein